MVGAARALRLPHRHVRRVVDNESAEDLEGPLPGRVPVVEDHFVIGASVADATSHDVPHVELLLLAFVVVLEQHADAKTMAVARGEEPREVLRGDRSRRVLKPVHVGGGLLDDACVEALAAARRR